MSTFTIQPMTREEMDFAVDLAAEEGWNPGLFDAEPFYATDPDGFLMGYLDGKPIGCVSAVSYEGTFGFMGFYIVLPEYRDQGYGIQLFYKALEHLEDHVIGGDGVFERLEDYQKVGFNLAYRNIRFEYWPGEIEREGEGAIKPLSEIPFDLLVAYDAECFPVERRKFLEYWFRMPKSYGVGWYEEGELKGYGVIRACRKGYKIGPLFADNAKIAESLFRELCSFADKGEPVYLDVPETNLPGMNIAERYGMTMVFGTGRIYIGEFPDIPLEKIFGVTSFELG
ncbi:MAG: GNAT family N-acetyltransferase [Candidatus Kapaibacterium sp.]